DMTLTTATDLLAYLGDRRRNLKNTNHDNSGRASGRRSSTRPEQTELAVRLVGQILNATETSFSNALANSSRLPGRNRSCHYNHQVDLSEYRVRYLQKISTSDPSASTFNMWIVPAPARCKAVARLMRGTFPVRSGRRSSVGPARQHQKTQS